jgi:hypothetical protein
MTQMTQISQIRKILFAAGEKFAREESSFGLGLFLSLWRAAGGAAGSGGAAAEEADGLAHEKRETGGDEEDHQKMLGPERHQMSLDPI